MRRAITAMLLIIGAASLAQNKTAVAAPGDQPVYFVDSVQINEANMPLVEHIAPQEIASLQIGNNPKYPQGSIYITLKDHSLLDKLLKDKLLTLADITEKNMPGQKKQIIYLVDNKMLTDTSGIRIPSNYVKNVKVVKANETPYFKTTFPKAVIVMISTKPEEMHIRGGLVAEDIE
ncbi:hypothetical protein HH214_04220 [Mucilaginibacter robiniae]|uniref:Uncharacterized protein n=1 Tax=Mucilaginibacter robiniae TaxID=2728022 RepID=A0A7L5DY59_9SPHI|nr:hypothetical protein [Mucilaginibacter robiniae]QJD95138.1 hypothetical protein HH214_04220 [Mucilaginibacter robiniae]